VRKCASIYQVVIIAGIFEVDCPSHLVRHNNVRHAGNFKRNFPEISGVRQEKFHRNIWNLSRYNSAMMFERFQGVLIRYLVTERH